MKEFSEISSNILRDGNSVDFKTGNWRNKTPIVDKEKCKNCMMCVPYCPEDCIKHTNSIHEGFDLDYCKGCGVCAKVCPFKAIEMKEGV